MKKLVWGWYTQYGYVKGAYGYYTGNSYEDEFGKHFRLEDSLLPDCDEFELAEEDAKDLYERTDLWLDRRAIGTLPELSEDADSYNCSDNRFFYSKL